MGVSNLIGTTARPFKPGPPAGSLARPRFIVQQNARASKPAMYLLAPCCERIAATTRKTEKVAILAQYFTQRTTEEAAISAVFLSGHAFPAYEETILQVGGSLLWRAVAGLSSATEAQMTAAYRRFGDLGAAAEEVLQRRNPKPSGQSLTVV